MILTLRENCPYSELFSSVFFSILIEYGEILSVFNLNAGKYGIYSKVGKIRTKITPNADTFYTFFTCNEFFGIVIKIAGNKIAYILVLGVISDMESALVIRRE